MTLVPTSVDDAEAPPAGRAVPTGDASAPGGASVAAGTSFWVDCAAGADTNPGTGATSPWASLAPVNTRSFKAGTVIHLKRGCTWDGGLAIRGQGAAEQPILVTPYGEGASPTVRHSSGGEYSSAIEVWGSHVVVDGLTARDAVFAGIRLQKGSAHNVVRNVEVTASGFGINLDGSDSLVTKSYVHDLLMIRNTPGGNDDYGAVGFQINGVRNEVSYNRCVRCSAASQDFGWDGGFVEIWNSGDDTYVHHNYALETAGFFEMGAESKKHHANNVRVAFNIIYDAGSSLNVQRSGKYAIAVTNLRFDHNTVVQATPGKHPQILFQGATREALLVRNNIFYLRGSGVTTWWGSGSYLHTNNIYYVANGASVSAPLGSGEITADPLFADLANQDFRLRAGSPAIGAGADLGYRSDYSDAPLPEGRPPAIGAVNGTLTP